MAPEIAITLSEAQLDLALARHRLRSGIALIKGATTVREIDDGRELITAAEATQRRAIGVIETVELFLRGELVPSIDGEGTLRFARAGAL